MSSDNNNVSYFSTNGKEFVALKKRNNNLAYYIKPC